MTVAAAPAYLPYLMSAGIAFAVFRRIRTHFGRQPWRPRRTLVRVVLMAAILAALAVLVAMKPMQDWSIAVGAAVGAGLGLLALRLTRIDTVDGRLGYTPNPWIGGALVALFLGRIVWRFASGDFTVPQSSSPLTLAVAATLVTYYLVQGLGLMAKMRHLASTPPTSVA